MSKRNGKVWKDGIQIIKEERWSPTKYKEKNQRTYFSKQVK